MTIDKQIDVYDPRQSLSGYNPVIGTISYSDSGDGECWLRSGSGRVANYIASSDMTYCNTFSGAGSSGDNLKIMLLEAYYEMDNRMNQSPRKKDKKYQYNSDEIDDQYNLNATNEDDYNDNEYATKNNVNKSSGTDSSLSDRLIYIGIIGVIAYYCIPTLLHNVFGG